MEYGIPIMIDVEAPSRQAAGQAAVAALAEVTIVGTHGVESWWTIDGRDKQHDRNDNGAGRVTFNNDETYVRAQDVAEDDVLPHLGGARVLYSEPYSDHWTRLECEAPDPSDSWNVEPYTIKIDLPNDLLVTVQR